MKVTTQIYGQLLITGINNYTGTYFSLLVAGLSHDSIWRYLNGSKLSSKIIWEKVEQEIEYSEKGCIIFDDTVLDKKGGKKIELARWQYSGAFGKVIMGIGVVTCIYYNPEKDKFWLIDSRIYQPTQDGKKKYEHLQDMLLRAISRGVKFRTVLMDTWYAIAKILLWIDRLGYKFVCPVRKNRQVLDHWTKKTPFYHAVQDLSWTPEMEKEGVSTKFKANSLNFKLYRLMAHPGRIDFVITNDHEAICTSEDAIKACRFRWKIELFHREIKQTTGIGKCQARNARAQRKHIITSMLAWIVMKAQAYAANVSIYQIKNEPLLRLQQMIWRKPFSVFST